MRIAVLVPEFPAITQTFTYTRLGTLSEKGVHVSLFYAKPGDFSLCETKLIERMSFTGVEYFNLPSERLGFVGFLKLWCNTNFFKKSQLLVKYFLSALNLDNFKNSLSYILRFAPLIFWQPDVIHIESSYLAFGIMNALEPMRTPIIISLRGADVDEKPLLSRRWVDFYKDSINHPLIYFHCVSEHIRKEGYRIRSSSK